MAKPRQRQSLLAPLETMLAATSSLASVLFLAAFFDAARVTRGLPSNGFSSGTPSVQAILLVLPAWALVFALLRTLQNHPIVFDWIIRHRVLLTAALVALCVIFNVSGSSVAVWSNYTGGKGMEGTILGIPRPIRSDEWEVLTPLSVSQWHQGYPEVSQIIRAEPTNVTLSVALPAWAAATAFRPFYWGFLLLGPSRGLSFFWCARLFVLLLVTFELFRLVTSSDDAIALFASLLITFAPAVQWWFAVNEIAETLIFGAALVLSLHHLLRANTSAKRWLYAALLAWSMGCYAFVLYPAWQIPFVYVFGAMGITDILAWARAGRERQPAQPVPFHVQLRQMLLPVLISVGVVVAVGVTALFSAADALAALSHSAYPGNRVGTGGGFASFLPNVTLALATPTKADWFSVDNVCEQATYISLFPLGIILAVATLRRRRDPLLCLTLLVTALLLSYGFLGFPTWLARITLLSNVTTGLSHQRLPLPLGYLDVMLLVRSLHLRDAAMIPSNSQRQRIVAFVSSLALALVYVFVGRNQNALIMDKVQCVISFLSILSLAVAALAPVTRRTTRGGYLLATVLVVVLCGLSVNPVQHGISALTDNQVTDAIQSVVAEDPDGVWASDSDVMGELTVSAGAKTVNSIALYPDVSFWAQVDPAGAYEDVYNRHAHIFMSLADETSFETVGGVGNAFAAHLTPSDVSTLGIDYWLSSEKLSEWSTDDVSFEPLTTAGPYTIFRVERQGVS